MARLNQTPGDPDPLQFRSAPSVVFQPVSARFIVGRDRMGRWMVNDREGKIGGMFLTEAAALRFARTEAGRDPMLVCKASEGTILELGLPSGIRALAH